MPETLKIIKIGGQVINEEDRLNRFLRAFAQISGRRLLVHGGGRKATEMSAALGIPSKIIAGRRITDSRSLEVAVMVYGGLINKRIVARLQAEDVQALGLSGADLNSIRAHKRRVTQIDYGYAGDIDEVNAEAIRALLNAGVVPVFCALTHNKMGQLLNTNADTIASALGTGLCESYATELYYCFEKEGVLADPDDDDSSISRLDYAQYQTLAESGHISAGMIPKLDNAYAALRKGVSSVFICSAEAIIRGSLENATRLCL